MDVADAARVPAGKYGGKRDHTICIGPLISAQIRQAGFTCIPGIITILITMPDIDANIRHGLAIRVTDDFQFEIMSYTNSVFTNILAKESLILRQVEWKWTC